MKKITLIRHAKSSWTNMNLPDHDRPLNKRGRRDAPFMSKMMAARGWAPEALISSTAKRAYTTAGHFALALGRTGSSIIRESRIYDANSHDIVHLIAQLEEQWDSVAFFGHNPTFTTVANLFYPNDYLDNLPTCGIVEIEDSAAQRWTDFAPPTAVVTKIHYPKQYF
jgi:phosphohistidine phosphatase